MDVPAELSPARYKGRVARLGNTLTRFVRNPSYRTPQRVIAQRRGKGSVRNLRPFGPRPGLNMLDEHAALTIHENSPYPFASEVEKPVPT